MPEVDLLIIGAGPTGLFAAYYAGFRGLRVAVVDSLPELGGQITAMYPEKAILDVAGFPTIKGRDLVEGLVGRPPPPTRSTSSTGPPPTLTHGDDARRDRARRRHRGQRRRAADHRRHRQVQPRARCPRATAGSGAAWSSSCPSFAPYAGKDVVIVGGGDSAFDWAQHLEPMARSVTLVHRRDAFRAHERTVKAVRDSSVEIITKAQVTALHAGDAGRVAEVEITVDGQEPVVRPAQAVVAALGLRRRPRRRSRRGGSRSDKRHVVVDASMRTNLARVFAAGDITEYPGKVRLIAVGFGEAATAVNNAAVVIDPTAHVFPGHSSEA